MLFHADRNVKENLFNMYKKDAMDMATKKNEMRLQKINEERQYLDNVNKREQLEEDRRKLEKMKRISDTMGEYNQMMSNKPDGRLKRSKFEDVKINSYGVSFRGNQNEGGNDLGNNVTGTANIVGSTSNNDYFQREYNINSKVSLSPRANNMKKLVSYDNNGYNLNSDDYMQKMQKMEQQKMYKDYLDSQVVQKGQNNYGKKAYSRDYDTREVRENPYNNKNYEIGGSILAHNPILNPINNFNYNKYISNNISNPQPSNYGYSDNYNSNSNFNNPNMNNNYYPTNYDNNYSNSNINMNNNVTPSTGERLRMAANSMMK